MPDRDVSATYDAIRDVVRTILGRTRASCGENDFRSAANSMGILIPGKFVMPDDERHFRMICDLALFEANSRGVRPFDRFLAGPVRTLPEHEQDVARRVGGAFFSLFKIVATHEAGGFWVEDVLNDDRRIWIVTTSLEDRRPGPDIFAMRIFDTGQFHVAITVILLASDKFVELCTTAKQATGRLPFRQSLAATMYGLQMMDWMPRHPSAIKFARDIARVFETVETARGAGSPPRRRRWLLQETMEERRRRLVRNRRPLLFIVDI